MDVVMAVVIFGFVSIVFTSFALLDKPDVDDLQAEAQSVAFHLEGDVAGCGEVLRNDTIDYVALECLFGQDYTTIRELLDVNEDFCIYLEDEQGQIVRIAGKNGWGSDELSVAGVPCGSIA